MLLTPIKLNPLLSLRNRIIMAPMTRAMAKSKGDPTDLMTQYYAKRADAGLIITEGTVISDNATGYRNVPGMYTQAHIHAWQKVTDAVHQKGGKIFCQLWHVGRVSHPSFLNGQQPISASSTTMSGPVKREKNLFHGESREMTQHEIKEVISQFVISAECAMSAGFDGIEIHGANGYLIDQFLHHDTNLRKDEYGETPENMSRFPLEIITALQNSIGIERIGLRLSPGAYLNEIKGSEKDKAVFSYLLKELNHFKLAYIHTGTFDDSLVYPELDNQTMTSFIRQHYSGNLIASGSYGRDTAEEGLHKHQFDMIAFGRPFIANPHLVEMIKTSSDWTSYEPSMLDTLN